MEYWLDAFKHQRITDGFAGMNYKGWLASL
jgi:hypothetical protein